MKICVSQFDVVPLAIERNLSEMKSMIDYARDDGCQLIVFPELCVSGYVISDNWLNRSFCHDLMAINEEIKSYSNDIGVVYGNIYEDLDIHNRLGTDGYYPNKDGRSRLYNAAYFVANNAYVKREIPSKWLPDGVQPKNLLPTYRFFDDPRYFFSLQDIAIDMGIELSDLCHPFVFEKDSVSKKIGIQICEDLWCKDYRYRMQSNNVTKQLVCNGADLIVNVSASPWTADKHSARDKRIQFLKKECEEAGKSFVPFVYCNTAGAQNNGKNIITFDGGSCIYNAKADLVKTAETPFRHNHFSVDVSQDLKHPIKRESGNVIGQKYQSIRTGLQHLQNMLGWRDSPKFVIGLSGGVDSAVVAALLTDVFGKDSVMAVNMPSQYNSSKTKNAAAHVAKALSIDFHEIPIDDLVQSNQEIFKSLDEQYTSPTWMRKLSDENIQAKARGTSILSNIAGRYGRMFTNNGNKLEIALGYATLYGDVGGVVAPIGDLTKAEVFEMAGYLNSEVFQDEVIPRALLPNKLFEFNETDIPPSAELKEAQVDPMKFGYHCALVEKITSFKKCSPQDVMQWYLSGNLSENLNVSNALIKRWGLEKPELFIEDLEWFFDCVRKSVFKRIQSPPIILTSPSAYGFDIRESQLPDWQSTEYLTLKNKVISMDRYRFD